MRPSEAILFTCFLHVATHPATPCTESRDHVARDSMYGVAGFAAAYRKYVKRAASEGFTKIPPGARQQIIEDS